MTISTSWLQMVGNTNTVNIIKNSVNKNKFPSVVIFSGINGTGKSTSAVIAGLQLTCANPTINGPCMQCHYCKENLKALESGGKGINLFKHNIGLLVKDKRNIENLVKEIFMFEQVEGKSVYILEEMHTMHEDDQTALLEEIDRMPADTHIIICTSQLNKIISPLKSRAIKFTFGRLKNTEAKLLFKTTCEQMDIYKLDKSIEPLILHYAKGVPRDIINLITFISNTRPTIDQIQEFLGQMSDEDVVGLLMAGSSSIYDMSIYLETVLTRYEHTVVIEQLKSFFVKAILAANGKIDELDIGVRRNLNSIADANSLYKLSELIYTLGNQSSESDLKYVLIKCSLLLQKRKLANVIVDNAKEVSSQITAAEENSTVVRSSEQAGTITGIKKMDLTGFRDF